jgi:putative N6-adenine-specific DNA methylase
MVVNPPYGERLSDQETMGLFYPKLGDALKKHYAGWTCHFISADKRMERALRLKPSRKVPLMNGDLDCRLYEFKVVAGSNRE